MTDEIGTLFNADTGAVIGKITQLTETGHVTTYPALIRREWIFGTAPDPRDEQIEMLEAALNDIYAISDNWGRTCVDRLEAIRNAVRAALIPAPESDMTITQEELPA